MFKIELGKKVEDFINGFKGTVIARCEYLNGCIQYQLEGDEPTKPGMEIWLDEQRLVSEEKKLVKTIVPSGSGGGFRSHSTVRH